MYQINSIEQLQKTGNLFRIIFTADRYPDYQLSISSLPTATNEEISRQINHYKNECGCTGGSIITGIGILLIFIVYLTGYAEISSIDLKQFLLLMLLITGVAATGKGGVILYARIRMFMFIRKTLAHVEGHKDTSFSNLKI